MHDLEATVVAAATPPGRGAVACVRLSGGGAQRIALAVFRPRLRRPEPGGPPSFGHFVAADGTRLDHGYLVLFPPGSSFTGEPSAEAWTHGSPAVVAALVRAALAAGAALAEPGEFTYRAVRNGRLDLARAEAVRDLVNARTRYQARVALAQAEGAVARSLQPLREGLEEWIARAEAAIEFVDESETALDPGLFGAGIASALATCDDLLAGFRTGRLVREGARLAIVGKPNVGKSSLFNRLLARDRAIVTDVPGTTRDTLEEDLDLDGIPVRLIDTAGLREVEDRVEREGVQRAHQARAEADLVLLVLDGSRDLDPDERSVLREAQGEDERTLVVRNKSDLPQIATNAAAPLPLAVSARTGDGIEELRRELSRRLVGPGLVEDPVITNVRHAEALTAARKSLAAALEAARAGMSEELVVEDLRLAMRHLGAITGEFTTEELYDRIFAEFCIGK